MRTFLFATRIGVCNKSVVEEWIELAIEGVVDEPVANACLVYIAWFRVADSEMLVPAVLIGFPREFVMQFPYIFYQMVSEFLYIFFLSFATQKLFPCAE